LWRLVAEANVPIEAALAALKNSSGGTSALNYMAAYSTSAAYADEVRPFLVKDVAVAEQVAAQLGLDLGFLASVVERGPMDVSAAGS
jgi:hypothetical protein